VGTVEWIVSASASQVTDHALKVAQLSKKRASSNNRESNPKTPNNATKNGNNFVTEELWFIRLAGGRPGTRKMGRTGGKDMMKRMAIGIAHPPGSLVEITIKVVLRKKQDKDEMQIITDSFTECAAGVSCATI
jgi:hypothetical protein